MAILVTNDTKLCVSGITGREGTFHALNNRRYGTNVVSGVTPGKGGQDVEGVPVFNTFHDAVAETGANTAMIFVPPRFAADSILEAEDAGISLIICITEGIPAHDELRVYNHLAGNPNVRLVGPNCPGILSPGKANVGIIPASFFSEGNVGVVSRSGTLTYQIGNELAQAGFGNSSIVGIGGDPVPGSRFIDIIAEFEADPETELIVMAGEIGGSAEEEAAEYIAANVSKPVVAYIAGFTAPPGKTMGHAGAIVSGTRRHRQGQAGGARGQRRARRPHADRGRRDRGRDRRLAEPHRLERGSCRVHARAMAHRSPRRGLEAPMTRILAALAAAAARCPPPRRRARATRTARFGRRGTVTLKATGRRRGRRRGQGRLRQPRARGRRAPAGQLVVVKLRATGSLDTRVRHARPGRPRAARHVAGRRARDRRRSATGGSSPPARCAWPTASTRFVALRLLPTGEIDPSFGAGLGYVLAGPAGAELGAMVDGPRRQRRSSAARARRRRRRS